MMELYMVEKKPMTLKGGAVRQPGDLVPEAVNFADRAKKVLVDAGLMVRVVVLNQRQYNKLEGVLNASK